MNNLLIFAQDQTNKGPMGPEFGKAAPVGLFVILALLVVVLLLGFLMNKRIRRMERRRAFADKHGIDLFDTERLEEAMRREGFDETRKGGIMFARTEVPVTDDRFQPSSGIATGADAIDAENRANRPTPTGNDRSARAGGVEHQGEGAQDNRTAEGELGGARGEEK